MTLRELWLNCKWTLGFHSVLMKEPTDGQLIIYAKMHRAVATKKCPVCGCDYWVIGNPKVKGHFSPVCGKRRCYLAYHTRRTIKAPQSEGTVSRSEIRQVVEKSPPARMTRREPSSRVTLVKPQIVKPKKL